MLDLMSLSKGKPRTKLAVFTIDIQLTSIRPKPISGETIMYSEIYEEGMAENTGWIGRDNVDLPIPIEWSVKLRSHGVSSIINYK